MKIQRINAAPHQQSNFMRGALEILKFLMIMVDAVLPPRCAFSGKVVAHSGAILPTEWAKLHFISAPLCRICGVPFEFQVDAEMECAACLNERPIFAQARAALVYEDQSRHLILRFKHADQTQSVVTFAPWMMRAGAEFLEHTDVIIPVPLHRRRLLKRRYNQAGLIASYIAKNTGIAWHYHLLRRVRNTKSQGHMKPKERQKNIKNAFFVPDDLLDMLKNKRVLLVDDVYTTGATVNECARVLLCAGAAEVNVLCLARVVKR